MMPSSHQLLEEEEEGKVSRVLLLTNHFLLKLVTNRFTTLKKINSGLPTCCQ